jgi:hypothetical protein
VTGHSACFGVNGVHLKGPRDLKNRCTESDLELLVTSMLALSFMDWIGVPICSSYDSMCRPRVRHSCMMAALILE